MANRWQFSLGALLLFTITAGALIGFFIVRNENAKLRGTIHDLRDEYGALNIDDPQKAWARRVDTEVKNHWRYRIYVPQEGHYRLGVQMSNVLATGIDRRDVRYDALSVEAGEYVIDFKWSDVQDLDGWKLSWKVDSKAGAGGLSGDHLLGRQRGFTDPLDTDFAAKLRPEFDGKSIEFDPEKPLILFANRASRETITPVNDIRMKVIPSTSEPVPGLVVWFEREPVK